METEFDIIVVGAGAAGLIAAGRASELGVSILIVEKMSQPGRKLRITGKGRCNLTNDISMAEFIKHIHPDGKKLRKAFSKFFSNELIEFLQKLNVKTVVERGGRIFPESEDAGEIVDALIKWCHKTGVIIKCNSKVISINITDKKVYGITVIEKNEKSKNTSDSIIYYGKKVIIATGGLSYPATGSTGDGYLFAKNTGHTVIKTRPALVPVETSGDIAQKLQGLSLKNVSASVWINEKKSSSEFGEMLFTHFGVSGPIILTLSRTIVDELKANNKVTISIDLKPALDDNKLDLRLIRDFNEHGKMKFSTMLNKLIPSKLIPVCCELTGVPSDKLCNQLSAAERKKLRTWLKDFQLNIIGYRNYNEAIITAGGVSTAEIDINTFESKIVKNLYFAGEILDFDADTGGYNLQIAFTSGWIAGENAAGGCK